MVTLDIVNFFCVDVDGKQAIQGGRVEKVRLE